MQTWPGARVLSFAQPGQQQPAEAVEELQAEDHLEDQEALEAGEEPRQEEQQPDQVAPEEEAAVQVHRACREQEGLRVQP
jgi:hypothetical protein